MKKMTEETRVIVENLFVSKHQKGSTLTAQLRQYITTVIEYESIAITNEFSDNPFSQEEFGIEPETREVTESRVAWINVPEDTTLEEVQDRLDAHKECRIFRVLSSEPILTEGDKAAIESGVLTYHDKGLKQIVKNRQGDIIFDDDNLQFRRLFLSLNGKPDIDLRGQASPKDMEIVHNTFGYLIPESTTEVADPLEYAQEDWHDYDVPF